MFNNHLAAKQRRIEELIKSKEMNEHHWKKRYQTEVQPNLVEHYNKRISSFIRKMEENPFKIKQDKITIAIQDSERQNFKFKNSEDWSSYFTPCERLERRNNEQIMKIRFGDSSLAHVSINRGDNYNLRRLNEFRMRQKSQQIQPPMKYSVKLKELKLKRSTKHRKPITIKTKSMKKPSPKHEKTRYNTMTEELDSTTRRENSDVFTDKTDGFQDNQNIELDALNYEKSKEVDEKRLHFKKLIELSLLVDDKSQRKQLKYLLKKCGFYVGKGQASELEGVDNLTKLMKQ